jgi:predicted enzyme involved in methoxymalonyl-ACP biosynthesis
VEGDGCVFAEVSYRDKFGALGRIAALLGRLDPSGARLRLNFWVMSCRAFSRRIEHHTLAALFERFPVDAIELDFEPTARNQPLAEFLATWKIAPQAGVAVLTRAAFLAHRGSLPHAQSAKAQLEETA